MSAWQMLVGALALAWSVCAVGCLGMAWVEDTRHDSPEGAAIGFAGFAMFGVSALAMWSEALR